MTLSDWINIAQAFLLAVVIPGCLWAIKKVTEYFKVVSDLQTKVGLFVTETNLKIAIIEKDVAVVQANCCRHQLWMEEIQRGQRRVDRNLIRVCTKLDVQGLEDEEEESQK